MLSSYLLQVLGDYFDGISPKSKVAFSSGEIELSNLRIKDSALDKFNLPIRIMRGTILKLKVIIPWATFLLKNSKPVVVEINDLFLQVGPISLSKINIELFSHQISDEIHQKFEKRDEKFIEESQKYEKGKDPKLSQKVIVRILENLTIEINNIHLRYEDSLSIPGKTFSTGISISKISFVTTNFREKKTDENSQKVQKLGTLKCVAIYWNCSLAFKFRSITTFEDWVEAMGSLAREKWQPQTEASSNSSLSNLPPQLRDMSFILQPYNGLTLRITHNETDHSKVVPKFLVSISTDPFPFDLHRDQFAQMLSVNSRIKEWQAYRTRALRRPLIPITRGDRESVRAWWRYAFCLATGSPLPASLVMWECMRRRGEYISLLKEAHYLKLHRRPPIVLSRASGRARTPSEVHLNLMQIESYLPSTALSIFREISLKQLLTEIKVQAADPPRWPLSPSKPPPTRYPDPAEAAPPPESESEIESSEPFKSTFASRFQSFLSLFSFGSIRNAPPSAQPPKENKKTKNPSPQDLEEILLSKQLQSLSDLEGPDQFSLLFTFASKVELELSTGVPRTPIISASMTVLAAAEIRSTSTKAKLGLDEIIVRDRFSESPYFPLLLHHRHQVGLNDPQSPPRIGQSRDSATNPSPSLTFLTNRKRKKVPHGTVSAMEGQLLMSLDTIAGRGLSTVKVSTRPLEINWNHDCILQLLLFFLSENSSQSLPARSSRLNAPPFQGSSFSLASDQLPSPANDHPQRAAKKFIANEIKIELNLHSPKLRIPLTSGRDCLVLDAGLLIVEGWTRSSSSEQNLHFNLVEINVAILLDASEGLEGAGENCLYLIEPFSIEGNTQSEGSFERTFSATCQSLLTVLDSVRIIAILEAVSVVMGTFNAFSSSGRLHVPRLQGTNTPSALTNPSPDASLRNQSIQLQFERLGVTLLLSPSHSLDFSINHLNIEAQQFPDTTQLVSTIAEIVLLESSQDRPTVILSTTKFEDEDSDLHLHSARQNNLLHLELTKFNSHPEDFGVEAKVKVGDLTLRVDPAQLLRMLPFCEEILLSLSSRRHSSPSPSNPNASHFDTISVERVRGEGIHHRLSESILSFTNDSRDPHPSPVVHSRSPSGFRIICEIGRISFELMIVTEATQSLLGSAALSKAFSETFFKACESLPPSEAVGFRFDALDLRWECSRARDLSGELRVRTVEITDSRPNSHFSTFKTMLGSNKRSSFIFKTSGQGSTSSTSEITSEEKILSLHFIQQNQKSVARIEAADIVSYVAMEPLLSLADSCMVFSRTVTIAQRILSKNPLFSTPSSLPPSLQTNSRSLEVSLDVINPHLFLVQDPTRSDSPAIVLKSRISLSFDNNSSEASDQHEMVLSDIESKSIHLDLQGSEVLVLFDAHSRFSHQVVDPFDSKLYYQRATSPEHLSHKLSIDLANFESRITIGDIKLMNFILQNAVRATPPHPPAKLLKSEDDLVNPLESFFSKVTENPQSFQICVDFKRFSFSLLNDLVKPQIQVCRLVLENLEFDANGPANSFSGNGSASVSADFYNPRVGIWEPVIEEWRPTLQVLTETRAIMISLQSQSTLQLNYFGSISQQVSRALFYLKKSSGLKEGSVSMEGDSLDYPLSFVNKSGLPIDVLDSKSKAVIASLKEQDEVFVHSSKLYQASRSSTKAKQLTATQEDNNIPTHFDLRVTGAIGRDRLPISGLPLNINRPRFFWIPSATVVDVNAISLMSNQRPPVEEEVFQNSRYNPFTRRWEEPWAKLGDPGPWTSRSGAPCRPPHQQSPLPSDKWEWVESEWQVDLSKLIVGKQVDSEGWYYHSDFQSLLSLDQSLRRAKLPLDSVRRRRWKRSRKLKTKENPSGQDLPSLLQGSPLAIFWDVSHKHDGSHCVTLRSGVSLENNLPFPIQYRINGAIEHGPVHPGETSYLPVSLAQITLKIQVRPMEPGYKWSAQFDCSLQARIKHQQNLVEQNHHQEELQAELRKEKAQLILDPQQRTRVEQAKSGLRSSTQATIRILECIHQLPSTQPNVFSCHINFSSLSDLTSFSLSFNAIVRIQNLLPCQLCFRCLTSVGSRESGEIPPGGRSLLSHLNPKSFLSLSLQIGCYQWSKPTIYDFTKSLKCDVDLLPPLFDPTGGLTVTLKSELLQGTGVEVLVYSEFALVDRTGLRLSVHGLRAFSNYTHLDQWMLSRNSDHCVRRSDTLNPKGEQPIGADQSSCRAEACWVEGGDGLTLFQSADGKIRLSLPDGAALSDDIEFIKLNSTKTPFEITLQSNSKKSLRSKSAQSSPYLLAFQTELMEGPFSRTRILRVIPRYCVVNLTNDITFEFRIDGGDITFSIPPEASLPLLRMDQPAIRVKCQNTLWSFGVVDLQDFGSTILHLPTASLFPDPKDIVIVHAEVKYSDSRDDSLVTVLVRRESTHSRNERDKLFLSVKNESSFVVKIRQDLEGLPMLGAEMSRFEVTALPNTWVPFGWADQSLNSLVHVSVMRSQVIHSHSDIKSSTQELKVGISWSTHVGATSNRNKNILRAPLATPFTRLLDDSKETVHFTVQAVGSGKVLFVRNQGSLAESSSPSIPTSIRSTLQLSLDAVSLSVIAERPVRREFMCMHLREMELTALRTAEVARQASVCRSLDFSLKCFQVDNFSETAVYPVLLSSLDPELGPHHYREAPSLSRPVPALHFTVEAETPPFMKTSIIKSLTLKLPETEISLDPSSIELFLLDVLSDSTKSPSLPWQSEAQDSSVGDYILKFNSSLLLKQTQPCFDFKSSSDVSQGRKIYFESFAIHPWRLRVSYFPTTFPREKHHEMFASRFQWSEVQLAVEGWGLTLGNFTMRERMFSWGSLAGQIKSKVMSEFSKNLASLMLSINMTGISFRKPTALPQRSSRVMERSEQDESLLILTPLDVDAIHAQEVVVGNDPQDSLAAFVDLQALPAAALAISKKHVFLLDQHQEIIWRCFSGDLSHCELLPSSKAVQLFLYHPGSIAPVLIPTGHLKIATKLYSKFVSFSSRMGQPWRTVPLDRLQISDSPPVQAPPLTLPLPLDGPLRPSSRLNFPLIPSMQAILPSKIIKSLPFFDQLSTSPRPSEPASACPHPHLRFTYLFGRANNTQFKCLFSTESEVISMARIRLLEPLPSPDSDEEDEMLPESTAETLIPNTETHIPMHTDPSEAADTIKSNKNWIERKKKRVSWKSQYSALTCSQWDQYLRSLDEKTARTAFEWISVNSFLRGARCCVVLILNHSPNPIQILRVDLLEGRSLEVMGVCGIRDWLGGKRALPKKENSLKISSAYDDDSKLIAAREGAVVFFATSHSPFFEYGHINFEFSTSSFFSKISTKRGGSSCEGVGGAIAGFLEKSVNNLWAKYVLVVI